MDEATQKGLATRQRRWEARNEKRRLKALEEEAKAAKIKAEDEKYMKEAIKQAKKAAKIGDVPIGCVLVKDGQIIARGYNRRNADKTVLSHAEVTSIKKACKKEGDWRLEDCTLYVTLEPCCHQGKQPPCVDAIIEAGIKRVVIGSEDPNPLVRGKGIKILKEHGIAVTEHVLSEECRQLNEVFLHFIQTKRPFVVMKYAMTMDGKIATKTGASKWITEEAARQHVAWQRHRYTAIMVGVGTVLADDPLLTCRVEGGENPIRIICDTSLQTPVTAQVVQTANQIPTILATCCQDQERQRIYKKSGCQILQVHKKEGHVDLQHLMKLLGEKKIDSILLEGGGTLNWAAISDGIVQKVQAYIAPKLFGGKDAKTAIEGEGIEIPSEAIRLKNSHIISLGDDVLIESEVEQDVHGYC